jgi:pilus assembly protein CpaB
MRPIAVIVAVVALLAAGMTAFLAKHWLASRTPEKAGQVAAVADVLVAARPIPTGTILNAGDLRYDQWPKELATGPLAGPGGKKVPVSQYVGAVTRYALVAGQPLVPGAVFRQKSAGVMAGILDAGMRAVSIEVRPSNSVAGFVLPGDKVDVLLAADITKRDGTAVGPIIRYASQVILSDVRVLAIDDKIAKGDKPALPGKTATLEVTPKQAEILTTAEMMGRLSLALRSFARTPVAVADRRAVFDARHPFVADLGVSSALRAYRRDVQGRASGTSGDSVVIDRGGSVSVKSF